jgi:carboxyl-terminal processing protease
MRRVLLAVLVLAAVAAGSFWAGARLVGDAPEGLEEVAEAARDIEERSARPVTQEELVQAAIRGMLRVLDDPYAAYLDPGRAREVEDLLSGSFVGIGVWLEPAEEGLRVTSVLDGSPAAQAGILPGELVVRAEGRPTAELTDSQTAALLGGPEGTEITLTVRGEGETREVEVRRTRISLTDVQARMLRGEVAYAHPLRFGEGTADRLRSELEALLARGAAGLVLDLRGNAGGLAEEAVATAGLFLSEGVAASMVRDGEQEELTVEGDPLERQVPMAVLVDGGTASASELVAGALQDRGRATIVGTSTFGKGSVLAVEEVGGSGSAIQFTTSFFLTPDGHRIEGRGILPDVPVVPGGPTDAQLDRAIQVVLGS